MSSISECLRESSKFGSVFGAKRAEAMRGKFAVLSDICDNWNISVLAFRPRGSRLDVGGADRWGGVATSNTITNRKGVVTRV